MNANDIGLPSTTSWLYDAAVLDNFGGGTISGGGSRQSGERSLQRHQPSRNPAFGTESDSFDVQLGNAEIFWQGITVGSEQTTKVTFTRLDKTSKLQKPQSNGMWGEDIIQLMYDVPNGHIQVWKFEGKTWMQQGKDIPLKFADGDVFSVYAGKDGVVEIRRNGKLLTTRQLLDVLIPIPTATETSITKDASVPELVNYLPASFRFPISPRRFRRRNHRSLILHHQSIQTDSNFRCCPFFLFRLCFDNFV